MPKTWTESLLTYRCPFDLREFKDAQEYPGWFEFHSTLGDRASMMEFEGHFRAHAAEEIEPWIEAVFWRLYGEPGVRDHVARKMGTRLRASGVPARSLWDASVYYMERPSRRSLFAFKTVLGLTWGPIGLASAFPAFMRPDWYPMVDTRVAEWVGYSMRAHNAADPTGPQLLRPPYLDSGRPVLTTRDFEFVESWYRWCWYTARKLSDRTEMRWRSRDVELAVLSAWGGRYDPHPRTQLNPLPAG